MTYQEPPSVLNEIDSIQNNGPTVVRVVCGKEIVDICYYQDIGWELEVRNDLKESNTFRQPYTGNQDNLLKSRLTLKKNGKVFVIKAEQEDMVIEKNGSISIVSNKNITFKTDGSPFFYHQRPKEVYEDLMSLKITDYSRIAPFAPKGNLFKTHMVRFQYDKPKGAILGLPGQVGELNRSGYRFELYNADNYLHVPGKPLYQSWPIIFHKSADGKKWVGVFYDNPSRTFVDLGDFYPEKVTFDSSLGNCRVYIAQGDSLKDVSEKITKLISPSALPPLWAFGYQQSRWSYMNIEEYLLVVKSMQRYKIPFDALYFDIDYMDGYRVFTINKKTFKKLALLIDSLRKDGVHSVCLVDPGIKEDKNYSVYNSLRRLGGYIKDAVGQPLQITVWPGRTILPDFSNGKTAEWWIKLQSQWLSSYPFDGIVNDMNEPSNFEGGNRVVAQGFIRDGSIQNQYNLYGYYMAKTSKQAWEKVFPKKRGFIISRSGYPGVSKYAMIWHGDNFAWWEHLRLAMHTTLLYSLCGAYYTGADIPGFAGNPPDDLAIRFFQLGAFLPLFKGHSIYFAKDKEPYAFSHEAREIIKDAIYLRYSLLREWYSGFERAIRMSKSPYLPVFTKDDSLVSDEFLLFDKFLVAPVLNRDTKKKLVYLPEGEWYELGNTQKKIKGNSWVTVEVRLSTIPAYVKSGSIVVRNTVGINTQNTFEKEERYEVYKDKNGQAKGYWFEDDGNSVNTAFRSVELLYRNGKVYKQEL